MPLSILPGIGPVGKSAFFIDLQRTEDGEIDVAAGSWRKNRRKRNSWCREVQ